MDRGGWGGWGWMEQIGLHLSSEKEKLVKKNEARKTENIVWSVKSHCVTVTVLIILTD